MLYANSSVMYIIVCKIMIIYFYYYIVHVFLIFTVLSLSVVLKLVFLYYVNMFVSYKAKLKTTIDNYIIDVNHKVW